MNNWNEIEMLARLKHEDLLRQAAAWRLAERARQRPQERAWHRRLATALRMLATWLSPGAAEPIVEIRPTAKRPAQ